MRILFILMIFFSFSFSSYIDKYKNNKKYDIYFMKEYNQYFYMYKSFFSWKIIKAQAIQESRLKLTATSYVGAKGLMQLMPFTYKELKDKLKLKGIITDAQTNIKMGVYYDYRMFKNWGSKRSLEDRYKLMFASYNSGLGHQLNAQKRCLLVRKEFKIHSEILDCNKYYNINGFLYQITGHHSKETTTYVERIFKYYNLLK